MTTQNFAQRSSHSSVFAIPTTFFLKKLKRAMPSSAAVGMMSGKTIWTLAAATTTAAVIVGWMAIQAVQTTGSSNLGDGTSDGDHVSNEDLDHKTSRLARKNNLVVNYHFHRRCNYGCKFCFHTSTNGNIANVHDAMNAMQILREEGMIRVNFSGGEPFLQAKWLGKLCKYCHESLRVSVSIVSNGSKITERWMEQYGKYLDVLAISCDSFEPETLREIGRYEPKKDHIAQLERIRHWCEKYNIIFKINSVICRANHHETMVEEIRRLNPKRWKVFQCLLIDGENAGPDAIRNAQDQVITKDEFDAFVDRHKDVSVLVPEDNDTMRNSYLILDEDLKFLNNVDGDKRPSSVSVLEDAKQALRESGFDVSTFKDRGGEWCNPEGQKLEW